MTDTTREKIKQVLGTMVDRNRYVFWYDEGGQMKDLAESIAEPGITLLYMDGNPFSIKYQIEKGEQPERGFVIYSTEAMPEDEDNWLLDYQEDGNLLSDSIELSFNSQSDDSTQREQKHKFMFKRQLSELNGLEIYLRKEQQIAGSQQFKKLAELPYRVSVLFQAEF